MLGALCFSRLSVFLGGIGFRVQGSWDQDLGLGASGFRSDREAWLSYRGSCWRIYSLNTGAYDNSCKGRDVGLWNFAAVKEFLKTIPTLNPKP